MVKENRVLLEELKKEKRLDSMTEVEYLKYLLDDDLDNPENKIQLTEKQRVWIRDQIKQITSKQQAEALKFSKEMINHNKRLMKKKMEKKQQLDWGDIFKEKKKREEQKLKTVQLANEQRVTKKLKLQDVGEKEAKRA